MEQRRVITDEQLRPKLCRAFLRNIQKHTELGFKFVSYDDHLFFFQRRPYRGTMLKTDTTESGFLFIIEEVTRFLT